MGDDDAQGDQPSELGALVRLGLKVVLDQRGVYIADYLDDRRVRRATARINELGALLDGEDLTVDELTSRVESDDQASEFFEDVLEVAARTRYAPKLRYLARCLSNALKTKDGAIPDMTWLRMAAVRDLEAIHIRLLDVIRVAQHEPRGPVPESVALDPDSTPVEEYLITRQSAASGLVLDETTLQTVMALLIRHGLVAHDTHVEVQMEIDLSVGDNSAFAEPDTDVVSTYKVTALGIEILEAIGETASEGLSGPN